MVFYIALTWLHRRMNPFSFYQIIYVSSFVNYPLLSFDQYFYWYNGALRETKPCRGMNVLSPLVKLRERGSDACWRCVGLFLFDRGKDCVQTTLKIMQVRNYNSDEKWIYLYLIWDSANMYSVMCQVLCHLIS